MTQAKDLLLAVDQGSTGSKVLITDCRGDLVCSAYRTISCIYPHDGWVEHDPDDIWNSVKGSLVEASLKCDFSRIRAAGITNQRETVILWEKATGKAVSPAISWQCTRSEKIVQNWNYMAEEVTEKTGLELNTYYSASKIAWLFERNPELLRRARAGEIAFGTVDSWLIWNLTGGASHATDSTNAGRTLFFNIHENKWDACLMEKMGIPLEILAEVKASDGYFGDIICPDSVFKTPVPIMACMGDQQSALFGQLCLKRGEAKCTLGTSLNLGMTTGTFEKGRGGIPPSIAWNRGGTLTYKLEGGVYTAGSLFAWIRDQLKLAASPAEVTAQAASVESSEGVFFVPAFTGLGAPHWNPRSRGTIIGLSYNHDRRHLMRAASESIALQTQDVVSVLKDRFGIFPEVLRVDGGIAKDNFMMQLFADIIGCRVERPVNTDRTPMGVIYMAGLSSGFWNDIDEVKTLWKLDRVFEPAMAREKRDALLEGWLRAVGRASDWITA